MPGSTISAAADILGFSRQKLVNTASVVSRWFDIVQAGGVNTQDADPISNPDNDIGSNKLIVQNVDGVTFLELILGYSGSAPTTDPVVEVFGRYDSNEHWSRLRTRSGSKSATLTTASDDITDGTLNYITVDLQDHIWDFQGSREVVVGVTTAISGSGDDSAAVIEARLVN